MIASGSDSLSPFVAAVAGIRKLSKDLTLSNGVTIPAGAAVVAPLLDVHGDPANYADPEVFDPFRFSRVRETVPRSQFVTPTSEYLSWGTGQHVWCVTIPRHHKKILLNMRTMYFQSWTILCRGLAQDAGRTRSCQLRCQDEE